MFHFPILYGKNRIKLTKKSAIMASIVITLSIIDVLSHYSKIPGNLSKDIKSFLIQQCYNMVVLKQMSELTFSPNYH